MHRLNELADSHLCALMSPNVKLDEDHARRAARELYALRVLRAKQSDPDRALLAQMSATIAGGLYARGYGRDAAEYVKLARKLLAEVDSDTCPEDPK